MIRRGSPRLDCVFPVFFFGDFRSPFLGFSWEGFGGVVLRDLFWESHMRLVCVFSW
jgi:hypothetical protein